MNVHYTARQSALTPEIQAYCEKRLARLRSLVDDVLDVNVVLAVQRNRHKAEINAEETLDMRESLNAAFDTLEKRIRKERAKWREKKRRGGRQQKALSPAVEAPEPERRVLRAAFFSLKPMSVEEALVQLDVKNKEVFLFRREDGGGWAAVYRRKDGQIGLVEPE
ncbi:MAG: HPF/RaiA family ribosome-associated protein [Acidobacteria bacterium]|nr:HPF/RaiA family ribosome-associated protein [Acidobacteriota bacterium]